MNRNIKAHLALLLISLIFGIHYMIGKSLMPVPFQPLQLLFLRSLGAVLLFWIFQRWFIQEKVARKDLLMLALCGLLGFAANHALFYIGLNLTTPVDASIIHVLNPVFVLVFASILIHEKVTFVKVIGIALGAGGALILILYGKMVNMSTNSFAGNILVMLNMLCYAMYLVLIKPMVAKYHTMTILKWVSFFGFFFILPFCVKGITELHLPSISVIAWLGVGYIVVFNTFIAYLLINYALKTVEASMASFYTYLQPVIASVMSVSLGTDAITIPKIIAALLIFGGVFLVSRVKKISSVQVKAGAGME
ncbi:MAG TPA: DMT family transporter [Bacteroidales bacterium]|nr:DMT family transporter [Bacteroidales bacterium]